jgi:hypothetical protein
MQRVTSKHAPRRDDELAHEEQSLLHGSPDEGRTEPRRGEAPGDDEPSVGRRPDPGDQGRGATTAPESDRKAALAATFRPSLFPSCRAELVEEATARFADDATVAALDHLPDRVYESVDDVWDALRSQPASQPDDDDQPQPGNRAAE